VLGSNSIASPPRRASALEASQVTNESLASLQSLIRGGAHTWLNNLLHDQSKDRHRYFPSIEKKYGRSIAEWQTIIANCGLDKHMAIVGYLKSEYAMGHGHANALVGWTLGATRATP